MYGKTIFVAFGFLLTVFPTIAAAQWTTETIEGDGDVGAYSSIAVGDASDVHISYYDISEADLKYATNRSGAWGISVLDSDQDAGRGTSIRLDRNGAAHISYFFNSFQWCHFPNRPIKSQVYTKYATNSGGSWVTQTIWGPETCTASKVSGTSTSLSIDAEGTVPITML